MTFFDDYSSEPIGTDTEDADNFLAYLESIIDEDHVQYARDTLEGIMETVRKRQHVTERQAKAVENIVKGGERYTRKKEYAQDDLDEWDFGRKY